MKTIANCGKCGLCLAACPVYQVLKEEQASPRARLQLIKAFEAGKLESSALLKEIISKCLMCGSCAVTCPSGINHYERFMEMRRQMVADLGEEPPIKALIHLLSKEFMLKTGSRLAALGQRITPEALAKRYKVGNIPLSSLPKLNPAPFRSGLDPLIPPAPGIPKKGRIAYFTGCATNYMFEDTGKAVVNLLTGLGYEVAVPKNQGCCAIPMLFHGARDKAGQNITTNVNALFDLDCDHIIVDCTTCGAALKDEYPAFFAKAVQEEENGANKITMEILEQKAESLSARVTDILSFISDQNQEIKSALRSSAPLPRAAYHAPCHSRNSFATHAKVQSLLKALPQIEYIPLANEAACCGGGGTFFYEHPDLARKMMDKKLALIKEASPDLWLTDCPVCRINLAGSLNPDEKIQVCHPVRLIAQAMAPIPGPGRKPK